MAHTKYKLFPYGYVPSATLSDVPVLVYFDGTGTWTGLSSVDDLRFYTPGLTGPLNWMKVGLALSSGKPLGWARVMIPSILSSASVSDNLLRVEYGGTAPAGGGPSTTLSVTGMECAWDMETTTPSDWSGAGLDLSDSTGSTATGVIGTACSYNGSDDYHATADLTRDAGELAVAAWVKFSGGSEDSGWVANQRTTSNDQWQLGWWGPDDYYFFSAWDTVTGVSATKTCATPGSWHRLVGTVRNGNIYVSIDGVESTGVAIGTLKTPSALPVSVGRPGWAYSYAWNGLIDDLRVYSRNWSSAEIAYDYNIVASPPAWGAEQDIAGGTNRRRRLLCGA